ncbi:MAG: hypothetical protein H0W79_06025 [Rubrobacteraceae bacterium]|jgi:hypothetical protein|nr:hypothetical protein [Rubrobacteraceae bacterium]
MVREVIEARETLHAEKTQVKVTRGAPVEVSSVVIPSEPQKEGTAESFTREVFEGTLDKVSRPTGRGKLAHLRPNSEEFARRKQEEIDLEERSR